MFFDRNGGRGKNKRKHGVSVRKTSLRELQKSGVEIWAFDPKPRDDGRSLLDQMRDLLHFAESKGRLPRILVMHPGRLTELQLMHRIPPGGAPTITWGGEPVTLFPLPSDDYDIKTDPV